MIESSNMAGLFRCSVLLSSPPRTVAHFRAVAKGEKEDRNMPHSWPSWVRRSVERSFRKQDVKIESYQALEREGRVFLVANGPQNSSEQ